VKSGTSEAENQGRAPGFDVPVNLVGGHRFPDAKPIDSDLLAAILRIESRLLPEPVVGRLSNWKPSPNIDPQLVPPIPDFLRRASDTVLVIVSDKLKARGG
jgi:hypothetical protein